MNIFIDIETIPGQPEDTIKAQIAESIKPPKTMSKPETIEQWNNGLGKYKGAKDIAVEKAYRDTSFDGSVGQICSIAFAVGDDEIETFFISDEFNETDIIETAFFRIKYHLDNFSTLLNPYFIGHFIGGFDLKFLYQRCVIIGIEPPFVLPFGGRHGKDFYCTQTAWAGYGGKISQNSLCKALGIEGKPNDIDGSKVWDFVKAGDVKRVSEYNSDDVEKNRQIYNRLHFKN